MLREREGFISGQEICNELGVSRTAVWKSINQLKEEGYEIESVSNRGYHLKEAPDTISAQEIQSLLESRWMGRNVIFLDEVDSTNNYLRRAAEEGAPHGTLAVAETQTMGKGRRGRMWTSPKGSGIWMSFLLRPEIEPVKASMLTLVAGLSVSRTVSAHTGREAQIKWPNDVVMNGRKICGILTEMSAEPDLINYVVVGIGINVNMENFPQELSQRATSLRMETGSTWKRSGLIARFCDIFEENYEIFMATGDLSGLAEEYNQYLVNTGREVKICEPGREFTAVAQGIDKEGRLVVDKEDGTQEAVFTGEVSVRGLYGYV